jgi:hypothetical protein
VKLVRETLVDRRSKKEGMMESDVVMLEIVSIGDAIVARGYAARMLYTFVKTLFSNTTVRFC